MPLGTLTTRAGWAAFVDQPPSSLDLLGDDERKHLTDAERDTYDQARHLHHSRLAVVATPTVNKVTKLGRRLMLLNRGQLSARRGLIVNGAGETGKTTAISQLGKHHEHLARRRRVAPGPFLPVVYVSVPPASTAKMLAAEIARFLDLPLPKSFNQVAITNAVCEVLHTMSTELVLVDEIHNLSLSTRPGAETSDQLKYLSERIPATFVYAGIDVEGAGLFSGLRGQQIASRFTVVATQSFAYGTSRQRAEWAALVATLEQVLRLHRHEPGTLLRHAEYLYRRTGGMIGSLSALIRDAAIEAIIDGSERITLDLLEAVELDRTAENQRSTTSKR
ncbi:TniB family NTP-binding protein [Planotetraspora thailandica]|uniref:TniB family NTP-binding protein n=1 Tax=Planotetraspora thailandica TaxID=487172 RepID=UPI001EF1D78F|nr:TniB family NTP-binding protein [Planotetraspora thailandica]